MKKKVEKKNDSKMFGNKPNKILDVLRFINDFLEDNWITRRFLRNTKIKVRLMVSFIALSIIPLTLIGIFSYSLSSNTIDSKIRTYSKQLIRETGIKTEDVLVKYKNYAIEMSLSADVQKKIETVLSGDDYSGFQAVSELNNILLTKFSSHKEVSFAAILLDNGEMVKYNTSDSLNNDDTVKRLKKLADDNTEDFAWTTETLDSKHNLICLRKIKGVSWSKNLGYLLIGINNENFLNIYKDINIGEGSELFVLDKKGKVISCSNSSHLGKLYEDKGLIGEIEKDKHAEHIFDYNDSMVSYKEINGTNWFLVGKVPISFINAEPNRIKSSLIVFVMACLGLSLFLAYLISGSISRPLDKMVNIIKEAKNGNLAVDIRDNYKDEIAIVSENFNEMAANIRKLIEQVRFLSVNNVLKSSELIAESSKQSHVVSEQIAKAIQEVASGSANQVEEINSTVSNMNQLDESFNKVEENMVSVFNMVTNTKELSHYSLDTVKMLNDKTNETCTASKEVIDDIVDLNQYMRQIKKIVETIVGIASQTKLLALNASIEAARAGETGRGFAVVAGDVNKLAHRSEEASTAINNIINNIQEKTQHTVDMAYKANRILDEQMGVVRETDDSFRKIYDAMSSISLCVENVSQSLNKAITSKDKAVNSIESISALANQAAVSAEEVAASTQEQIASSEELAHFSQELNNMALKLEEAVEKFTLK
ncbi:methyl-accepting chemotaxis protein [Pseudobacteroides cellulosolvens]|uniref:Methyl-accepting chemotaxis sensory transducer n=1 Tax=Pseudobacteroides cellulosolvens ATCC 35603 = DSM 2933 TaxID=398512 RepID=A0A0L6JHM5_9FIRM|nr:methyl-accepting chemotaxis protein [Pseudobacteroides cellulosolvens]KNY25195.1 methyl-accepting chemotaxis sensory transducer [Pseudobacteroides cellulosolvens ATCC 35603 = DSM 2933]